MDAASHHSSGNRHAGTRKEQSNGFLWSHDHRINLFLLGLLGLCGLQLRCRFGPLPTPTWPRQFLTCGKLWARFHPTRGWELRTQDLNKAHSGTAFQPLSWGVRWSRSLHFTQTFHPFCKGNRVWAGPKEAEKCACFRRFLLAQCGCLYLLYLLIMKPLKAFQSFIFMILDPLARWASF